MSFQSRVGNWVNETFGTEVASDKKERIIRFLEEATELAQSIGMPKDVVSKIVDYVYSRPVGEIEQEIGGVCVTLAALANAFEISLIKTQEKELERVEAIDKNLIRKKQNGKPIRNASVPEEMIT